jgi:hypothetical protein
VDEYTPADLTTLQNAGMAILPEQGTAPLGPQEFRGLPFLIGANPERCFVAFGDELQSVPLSIPVEERVFSVVVAHRLLTSGILAGGPVGDPVADYLFIYESGERARVTIRARFEIAEVPTAWGQLPFRAVPDQQDSLPPRETVRLVEAGLRQTEVNEGAAHGYYLWAWQNPRPMDLLVRIMVVPAGPRFLIAGATVGHIDEHPFVRSGARAKDHDHRSRGGSEAV